MARVTAAVLSLQFSVGTLPAAPHDRFWIALVDGTTLLTPIALYGGDGRWFNPWPPRDSSETQHSIDLGDVPLRWWGGVSAPETWNLWRSRGGQVALHLRELELPDECSAPWALRTDYELRSDDPRYEEAPEYARDVGIASDAHIDVQPFIRMTDPEISAFLAAVFPRLEAREIVRERESTARLPDLRKRVHGPIERTRHKATVRYRIWSHHTAVSGAQVYFGRSERPYRDDGGFTIVRVEAWVFRTPEGHLHLASARTSLFQDSSYDRLHPVALLWAGGDLHALATWEWSDGRDAQVLRLRPSGVTLMASKTLSAC